MGGPRRLVPFGHYGPAIYTERDPTVLYPLVFAGLVIAVILYAALIRRRADGRAMGLTLATQLTASNQTALERIADAARRRRESLENAPAVAAPAAP